MTPLISVITPVFNGERFIEGCLRNVIEQNCVHVEHLILDGGSVDATVSILQRYSDLYPHIRWLSAPDRGQSDAMNKGISLARGEIVGFLNVDDYYEPGILNRIVVLFQQLPEPSIAVGNCNVWLEDGSLWFVSAPRKLSWKKILAEQYFEAFPMNPSAYFYHRSLHDMIGLYKVDEHYAMDLDFIIRALQSAKVNYFDELWGNYRYLPGTKTYIDDKSGGNAKRIGAMTAEFRRNLPLSEQVAILIYRYMGKIAKLLRRE